MSFTTRPEIRGTLGVVTSTHWLASTVGFAMLERGGNAFDAAVATGFTLQIVEPHLTTCPVEGHELVDAEEALRRADIVVVLVGHRRFSRLPRDLFMRPSVIDTVGLLAG